MFGQGQLLVWSVPTGPILVFAQKDRLNKQTKQVNQHKYLSTEDSKKSYIMSVMNSSVTEKYELYALHTA